MLLVTLARLGLVSASTLGVALSRLDAPVQSLLHRRNGPIDLLALNNLSAGGYYAEIGLGTPPQRLTLLLDTGSSDTWVNSVDADLCRSHEMQAQMGLWCEPQFDPRQSSSLRTLDPAAFDITYLDQRKIHGDYVSDTLSLAGHAVAAQQLGLALESARSTGIMGLGLSSNVAARRPYPALVDNMVAQGIIDTPVFSLHLDHVDAKAGSILFGGLDLQKFLAKLVSLPLLPDDDSSTIRSYAIRLRRLDINGVALTALHARAILDSGSTITLLPYTHTRHIHAHYGVRSLPNLNTPLVDCARRTDAPSAALTFHFDAGASIRVPINDMIMDIIPPDMQSLLRQTSAPTPLPSSWRAICVFGIASASDYAVSTPSFAILGDSFLRSAYIVYDLANRQLGLAQANPRSRGSNIIPLSANSTTLSNYMGVDESKAVRAPNFGLGILISALAIVALVTTFLLI